MKQIIQIVPSISHDGDFNVTLAEAIRAKNGITSHFITYQSMRNISEDTPSSLFSLIPQEFLGIILHYNFRHYDNPHWIFRVLQNAKKIKNFKLIILVHELNATYKKKGLTFPAFRFLLTSYKTFHLADLVVTTTSRIKSIVSQLIRKSDIVCLPNFSTIGEPQFIPALKERKPHLIVFGSKHTRPLIYTKFSKNLLNTCRALEIEQIYDIGYPCELNLAELKGINIIAMGFQPKEAISDLMLTSRAGFLDYSRFPKDLGKSTIFAAYTAHGLVPVLTRYNPSEVDGIEINKHYLVSDKHLHSIDLSQLQQIADNAYSWYQNHSLTIAADFFSSCFLN